MSLFKTIRSHRLLIWALAAVVLVAVIAVLSPQQLPVTLYKLSLVCLAAVIGYHLDRALFPYASPGSYLVDNWKTVIGQPAHNMDKLEPEYPVINGYQRIFAAVLLRRAIVVTAVILGVTLGL
ncbi:putative holin [Limnobaculum xujianqingii]|uniref:putative holin n=1 Tax=Limnobaculum xujianqingii TaxID=2738837 RepID=UPI001129FAF9|nr:putative holin [Limnobaculum xujianqingii]